MSSSATGREAAGVQAGEEVEWDHPFWQQVIIGSGETSCLIPLWAWQAGGALAGTENLSRTEQTNLLSQHVGLAVRTNSN